jgi:hypothetical protein
MQVLLGKNMEKTGNCSSRGCRLTSKEVVSETLSGRLGIGPIPTQGHWEESTEDPRDGKEVGVVTEL